MSDFESRLRDALSAGAEDAPDASELADGARRRSRARRRGRLVVAAAVAVAVVVPVGVAVLGDGSRKPPAADDPFPDPEPAATRIETWHDIQLEVPASWGYGARTGWCAGREAETPVVQRPDMAVTMVDCAPPHYSFGVTWSANTFRPAYPSGHVWRYEPGDWAEYPAGAWLGHWYDDQYLVEVAAVDKQTVQEIVDSVRRVEGVDGNGCPVRSDGEAASGSGEMSVCRYGGDGWLEQSELLSPSDTSEAITALDEAPPRTGGIRDQACLTTNHESGFQPEFVLMRYDETSWEVRYAECRPMDRGVFGGAGDRRLTADVMYWALSPGWFGAIGTDVPFPKRLRELTVEPTEPAANEACPASLPAGLNVAIGSLSEPDPSPPPRVCRLELSWQGESGGTYLLDKGRTLDDEEAARIGVLLDATPPEDWPYPNCREGRKGRGELFLVVVGDEIYWVNNTECGRHGVQLRGDAAGVREITPALLDALGSPYGLLR